MGEPFGIGDDHVELIAMNDEIPFAVRGNVDHAVHDLHIAKIGAQIIAQEFVMIAGQIDDPRTAPGLVQQHMGELIVLGRPVPLLLQAASHR